MTASILAEICMVFLFYILQKIVLTTISHFPIICYYTSFNIPTLSGISVAHTSKDQASAVLLLMTVGKYIVGVASNNITFITNFMKNMAIVSKFGRGDTQTEWLYHEPTFSFKKGK
jgi:hypothetical protein